MTRLFRCPKCAMEVKVNAAPDSPVVAVCNHGRRAGRNNPPVQMAELDAPAAERANRETVDL